MTSKSFVKINTVAFKECMTPIISVTKTDTLLQAMDGFNKSTEINRLSLQKRVPKIGLPKK